MKSKGIVAQMQEAGPHQGSSILDDIRSAIFDTSLATGERRYMMLFIDGRPRMVRSTAMPGGSRMAEIQNLTNERYRKLTTHERDTIRRMFDPEGRTGSGCEGGEV